MDWTKAVLWKFNVPVIKLFTFDACGAALEWGAWKIQASKMKPGESRLIPGLPEEMSLSYTDIRRKTPPGHGGTPLAGRGRPKPRDLPFWVHKFEGSIALMFNTNNDLEQPFLSYMADQIGIPAFGMGPLLPKKYWKTQSGSLISDCQIRDDKRQSNVTEHHVIQWLETGQQINESQQLGKEKEEEEEEEKGQHLRVVPRQQRWDIMSSM